MTLLRSLFFQIAFYLNFFLHGLMTPFALLGTSQFAFWWGSMWMRNVIRVWSFTTGSTYEYRGLENLPEGGFIVASKHQSTWETLGLAQVLGSISYIMKQELMYIPIFGWFCRKAKMIPINRGKGQRVLAPMIKAARAAIDEGRRIIIFMEGTRVPAGAKGRYKGGVASLYEALQCPVVPVAVNTGLYWPRNSFWRYRGHVIVEFLPPIMPGKAPRALMNELEETVEAASNRLILEAALSDNPPPTVDVALDRLFERGVDISAVRK